MEIVIDLNELREALKSDSKEIKLKIKESKLIEAIKKMGFERKEKFKRNRLTSTFKIRIK